MARKTALSTLALFAAVSASQSFAPSDSFASSQRYQSTSLPSSSTVSEASASATFEPVFDFQQDNTVESFERIDDAIMGGISTSAVRNVPGEPYASWSGVCRIDGGGFCGMRTLAFEEPLQVGDADGFYIDCRLTSDDEPDRRVWKMTTRTERSRGEELYQAQFTLPCNSTDEWTRVRIPFTDFKLVRGPRMVEGGAPLNATGGIYQIGLSLSKFQISRNMTEIDNFRPGYFELQLQTIGLYSNAARSLQVTEPNTLTPAESKRKRPLIVKLLFPVIGLLFSEESRRRRSAMKVLMEERGLSRSQAIMFGIRKRAQSYGMPRSLLSYAGIVLVDTIRAVFRAVINYGIFFPLRLAILLPTLPEKILKPKPKTGMTKGASN